MYKLEELKNNIKLINAVEWDLNPAVAVGRHLEWGAGWTCDRFRSIKSGNESVYFAVSTWDRPAKVVLIKRTGFDMEELAEIKLPEPVEAKFLDSIGNKNGVYELDKDIKKWLKDKLDVH
jgi:hypothetical protein